MLLPSVRVPHFVGSLGSKYDKPVLELEGRITGANATLSTLQREQQEANEQAAELDRAVLEMEARVAAGRGDKKALKELRANHKKAVEHKEQDWARQIERAQLTLSLLIQEYDDTLRERRDYLLRAARRKDENRQAEWAEAFARLERVYNDTVAGQAQLKALVRPLEGVDGRDIPDPPILAEVRQLIRRVRETGVPAVELRRQEPHANGTVNDNDFPSGVNKRAAGFVG